jgi:GLPGLI family protein
MKKILFLLCCVTYFSGVCQTTTNGYSAVYEFMHMQDTIKKSDWLKERYLLVFNEKGSKFISYPDFIYDSLFAKLRNNESSMTEADRSMLSKSANEESSVESFYQNFSENKFTYVVRWITGMIAIPQDVPSFNWELIDSTKTVNGLQCSKAQGFWRGRYYTAWYARSVPTKSGPWKASGLPGLIVSLYDSKNEVRWQLAKLYKPSQPETVKLPEKIAVITQKQFDDMIASARRDVQGYLKANTGAAGSSSGALNSITISVNPGSTEKVNTASYPDNPIERP